MSKVEFFKKGQLVPKRLGFVKVHNNARHNIRFGSDVSVIGNTIYFDSSKGCAIHVDRVVRRRKNGTMQNFGVLIKELAVVDRRTNDEQMASPLLRHGAFNIHMV